MRSAQLREDRCDLLRRRVGNALSAIDQHALAHARKRGRKPANVKRIEPRRLGTVGTVTIQRIGDRSLEVDRFDLREITPRSAIADDHFVAQSQNEWLREPCGNRSHEVNPVRGKARRKERYDDDCTLEITQMRVPQHHVTIGHDVGAADLVDARNAIRKVERGYEIAQDVRNGYRLRTRGHPSRRNH